MTYYHVTSQSKQKTSLGKMYQSLLVCTVLPTHHAFLLAQARCSDALQQPLLQLALPCFS
jgi:hypothetical protein